MKKLKFRAWDNSWKVKVMLYFGLFDTDCGYHPREATDIRDAIIMQYTGLHDKNDKEIYEGDMYKDEALGYQVITFLDGGFTISSAKDLKSYWKRLNFNRAKEIEIIGNIYENKELLNVAQIVVKRH